MLLNIIFAKSVKPARFLRFSVDFADSYEPFFISESVDALQSMNRPSTRSSKKRLAVDLLAILLRRPEHHLYVRIKIRFVSFLWRCCVSILPPPGRRDICNHGSTPAPRPHLTK